MKSSKQQKQTPSSDTPKPPELARRRENRNSTIMSGRTIGEKRERLETKSERAAARKKDKLAKTFRIILTAVGFLVLILVLISLYFSFGGNDDPAVSTVDTNLTPESTNMSNIEIIDEDSPSHSQITSRMEKYINQVRNDLKELGYNPVRAVIPSGSIREINIYLDNQSGFIKMTIDRDSAVSAEDADRMIRYLGTQGISDYSYIDVRIDGKAYWK